MHIAFEEAKKDAAELSIPVTGSEVVGLVPLKALLGTVGEIYTMHAFHSFKKMVKYGFLSQDLCHCIK